MIATPLKFNHAIPLLIDDWIDDTWDYAETLTPLLFTYLYPCWFAFQTDGRDLLIAEIDQITHFRPEYAPVEPL